MASGKEALYWAVKIREDLCKQKSRRIPERGGGVPSAQRKKPKSVRLRLDS